MKNEGSADIRSVSIKTVKEPVEAERRLDGIKVVRSTIYIEFDEEYRKGKWDKRARPLAGQK